MNIATRIDDHAAYPEPPVRLGYITSQSRGAGDIILTEVATRLLSAGHKVYGAVQNNTERTDGDRCDMDIVVLPGGQQLRVSQALGPGAKGCRLDNGALAQAVADVEKGFSPQADLLVVNKFGKQEAIGGGFRDLIANALSWGVPVLTSVNALNLDAFKQFAAGIETQLQPDDAQIAEWVRGASKARDVQCAHS
ncbi:MAG: DUF2478 domain-containing protein [Thalassovita sp.]